MTHSIDSIAQTCIPTSQRLCYCVLITLSKTPGEDSSDALSRGSRWLFSLLSGCTEYQNRLPGLTRNHEARRRRRPPPGCRPRRGIRLHAVSFFGFAFCLRAIKMRTRARRDVFVMGGSTSGNGCEGGVGGRRGRALDHIDDPWTKNVYKVASTGRSACLSIFSEEYWHRICAAFSDGPRVGPEQRRAQGRKPVAASESSCCSRQSRQNAMMKESAALGYATACVASRMVMSGQRAFRWRFGVAHRFAAGRRPDRCQMSPSTRRRWFRRHAARPLPPCSTFWRAYSAFEKQ